MKFLLSSSPCPYAIKEGGGNHWLIALRQKPAKFPLPFIFWGKKEGKMSVAWNLEFCKFESLDSPGRKKKTKRRLVIASYTEEKKKNPRGRIFSQTIEKRNIKWESLKCGTEFGNPGNVASDWGQRTELQKDQNYFFFHLPPSKGEEDIISKNFPRGDLSAFSSI